MYDNVVPSCARSRTLLCPDDVGKITIGKQRVSQRRMNVFVRLRLYDGGLTETRSFYRLPGFLGVCTDKKTG